ncbi:MAG: protein phosphatase 2C domain-containing protein, partial [Actinobacteria bacterium]|nr:protein phosphatase 2C domain-containing protein [Actinomycetota bacterium]
MPKIIAGYASDTGRVRERNEDLALVDPPLFAVADGMGGHAGGAEAASLAITALRQSYRSQSGIEGLIHAIRYANFIVWQKGAENSHLSGMGTTLATLAYLTGGTSGTPNGAIAGIEDSYNAESGAELSVGAKTSGARYATRKLATNKKWYQRLLHTGRHTGRHYENAQKVDGGFARTYPSTVSQQDRYGRAAQQLQQGTATEAASDKHSSGASPHDNGGHFVVANVGDSRIYRYHSGRMIQISQDHSVAEELVRKGELTEAEAAVHPKRHTLTRVIGMGQEIDIDMWEVPTETGDRFLLCTDGLSNEVSDETLSDILSARIDPQQAAELMVKTANRNGGSDNITAVIVDVLPDSMAYNTADSISQDDVPTRSTDTGRQLPESPTTPADQSSSAPVEGSTLTSPGNFPSGAGLSSSLPPTANSPGSASRGIVQSDDAAVKPSALSGEEGSSTADSTTIISVAAIKTAEDGIGTGTGTGEYAASGSAAMQNSIGVQRSTRAQSSTRTQKNYAVKRVVGSGVPSPPVARWWHSGSGHRGRSMFNQGSNGYSRNRVEAAGSSRVSGQSLPRYEPEYRRYSGHRLISFRSVLFTIVF